MTDSTDDAEDRPYIRKVLREWDHTERKEKPQIKIVRKDRKTGWATVFFSNGIGVSLGPKIQKAIHKMRI